MRKRLAGKLTDKILILQRNFWIGRRSRRTRQAVFGAIVVNRGIWDYI